MKNLLTRDNLVRALIAALLIGCTLWVASCTEWVEVDIPTPAQGEAAKNSLYTTQQLARRLGAEVTISRNLDSLPPRQATLLLTSWHWSLFPERTRRLRQWVEQGGQLVVYASALSQPELKPWLPVHFHVKPRVVKAPVKHDEDDEEDDDDDQDAPPARRAMPAASSPSVKKFFPPSELPCVPMAEPDSVPPSYADGDRRFLVCSNDPGYSELESAQPPLWSLADAKGPHLMRAALGQGSVTVVGPWGFFDNERVLKGDNAQVIAAALQMRRGAQLWFVSEETRPPFLHWLWQRAWVAVLLLAAALAAALWRNGVRFGPLQAGRLPGRRSMAEQITGTAQFLQREGGAALHAAQLRALDAAAAGRLRGYAQMDRSMRAQAIARATGLNAQALGLALDRSIPRRRVDLPPVLELLETARRLLAQKR